MKANESDWSRRHALFALAGGLSVGCLFKTAAVRADQKMTLEQARYQGSPNGIYSCGNCSLFERPKSCKVVDGDVNEDGWCKAYSPVD